MLMSSYRPRFTFILLITSTALIVNACTPLFDFSEKQSSPQFVLIGAPADSTPTPTAFQPIPPTKIPQELLDAMEPTAEKLSPTATASYSTYYYDTTGGSSPMGLFKQPPNQMNVLLMGSDQRPYDGGFRTDVMILMTINFDTKKINLTSFPRDLYVYIPGWSMDRINTAQIRGGFELTAATLEYNFGVRPDHWALINFDGFVQLIDLLNGINVNVAQKLRDQRDKHGIYTVRVGMNRMDGETALWYVRSRKSTSDFDRARRQQEVLQAIFSKLLTLDMVKKAPQIFSTLGQSVETDMTYKELSKFIPLASQFQHPEKFGRYVIDASYVYPWINPYNGAAVLLPNQPMIRELMRQALNAE